MNGHHKLLSNQIGLGDKIVTGLAMDGLLLCGKCGLTKPLSSTRSLPNGTYLNGNSSSGSSSSGSGSSSGALGQVLGVERGLGVPTGYEDNNHNSNHNHSISRNAMMCTCPPPRSHGTNRDLLSDPAFESMQVSHA